MLAAALDRWWQEVGAPDPWWVVEAGAGSGALAASVLAAQPACVSALRYVCVERSPELRRRQSGRLHLEPAGAPADVSPGGGPAVSSVADLPAGPVTGVVLANELLDNLPFVLLERAPAGWAEVRVGLDAHGGLTEVVVEASGSQAAEAERLAPNAPPGARVPLQHAAADWLRAALDLVSSGRVVVFDYADTTAAMATRPWTEWVRTYRGHERGGHPLHAVGEQDVTCEVALDQLAREVAPTTVRTQADFLAAHGIAERRAAAAEAWRAQAHVGDLEALRARSRVGEADALTDPSGLGAFRALEWEVRPAGALGGLG